MSIQQKFRGTNYRLSTTLGQKPPVVLIHGVGLNHTMWHASAELLADDFTVLTYDFLGHGESDNPDGERKIIHYVEQLNELLDHLGINRFALIGFSMGAIIAQAFASLQPQRLTHLALLHSVCSRTDEQRRGAQERYAITRDYGSAAVVEAAIARWFSTTWQQHNRDAVEQIRKTFNCHNGDGYLKAYRIFAHLETEMTQYPLNLVTCPALVITGSDDIGSTPEMARILHRELPNAQLIINRKHRHMAPVEHSALLTAQLNSFLTSTTE